MDQQLPLRAFQEELAVLHSVSETRLLNRSVFSIKFF